MGHNSFPENKDVLLIIQPSQIPGNHAHPSPFSCSTAAADKLLGAASITPLLAGMGPPLDSRVAEALANRPAATSEPSQSQRNSIDHASQSSLQRTSHDGTLASQMHSPFGSSSQICFDHSHDDISVHRHRASADVHPSQTPAQRSHGVNLWATSAPLGSLDAPSTAAIAAILQSNTVGPAAAAAKPDAWPSRQRSGSSAGTRSSSSTAPSAAQRLQRAASPANDSVNSALAAVFSPQGQATRALHPTSPTLAFAGSAPQLCTTSERSSQELEGMEFGAMPTAAELSSFLAEAFGAHLTGSPAPATSASLPPLAQRTPSRRSLAGLPHPRSSIDILLDGPASSGPASRQSLDSLQELLSSPHTGWWTLGQQAQHGGGTSSGNPTVRSSADSGVGQRALSGSSVGNLATMASMIRASFDPGSRSKGYSELASGSVTVVAQPTGVTAGAGGGPTTAACASSVVDRPLPLPQARQQPPTKPELGSSAYQLAPAMMDADLHDTFGAHAWYCGPPASSSRPVPVQKGSATASASGAGSGAGSFAGSPVVGGVRGNNWIGGQPAVSSHSQPSTPPSLSRASPPGTAMLLEPTAVAGQHSVTLHDAQCTVPSLQFLRQRRLAKAQQASEGAAAWGGGYIAEAKRVLSEAMSSASKCESDICDTSYSGAIGPLMRHLLQHSGDEPRARSALHTLSLLVSNQPNRSIIASMQGRAALAAVLHDCPALDVREQAVQILWDLDTASGRDTAAALQADDLFALLSLLEDTVDAAVASHALHLLRAAVDLPAEERVVLPPERAADLAQRLTREMCAHKHHLQDAAQYSLGSLLGAVLSDPGVPDQDVNAALSALLGALCMRPDSAQCQVLLTVASCLAGMPRLRSAMVAGGARHAMLQFSRRATDSRLQARALSLVKVLNKEEGAASHGANWYFGPEELGE